MQSDGWAERLPILTGHAWAFGLHVTADLILSPEHGSRPDPERFLMVPIDATFPTRVRPGDFVIGGGEFAAGTRDDGGVRAFLGARIAALIAFSFDSRFAALALSLGLPAIEIHEALAIHTGARLRVDLEASRVVNLSSGDRYPIRNLTDAMLEHLRTFHA
jgi:3-isopropylmalate/(R)-2-methylmalate dehydratase small subunit